MVLSYIHRDWRLKKNGISCELEFCFMIKKSFMKLSDGWWSVTTFNLVYDRFVVFMKTLKNEINLIFMIYCLTKDGELIKTRCDSLEVHINSFALLFPVFKLCLQLFDVPADWLGVGGGECCPGFKARGGARDQRLEWSRDSANKSTINKFVLTFPKSERWIDRDLFINDYCGRRSDGGAINVTSNIIAIKESVDLETPHEVIAGSELSIVRHVHREDGLSINIDSFCHTSWERVCRGTHREKEKEIFSVFEIGWLLIPCKVVKNIY